MFKEFKAFAMRGNVLDMAIGVIIGAAFGKIVTSFVNDILMPPLGLILGKVDFSDLFVNLSGKPAESLAQAKAAGLPTLNYGLFINTVLDFLIVAFAIFLLIQQVNRVFCPSPHRLRQQPRTVRTAARQYRSRHPAARSARRNSRPDGPHGSPGFWTNITTAAQLLRAPLPAKGGGDLAVWPLARSRWPP